jgi:small subunit ribosomal protein S11
MSEIKNNDVKIAIAEEHNERSADANVLFDDIVDTTVRKAKKYKNIAKGISNILATFNNTNLSLTNPNSTAISWANPGKCNFRGSRKSTAYAAQIVVQDVGKIAISHSMKEVSIKVKGPGMGRDATFRTIQAFSFVVDEIIDVAPIPHNGCRSKKARRA